MSSVVKVKKGGVEYSAKIYSFGVEPDESGGYLLAVSFIPGQVGLRPGENAEIILP